MKIPIDKRLTYRSKLRNLIKWKDTALFSECVQLGKEETFELAEVLYELGVIAPLRFEMGKKAFDKLVLTMLTKGDLFKKGMIRATNDVERLYNYLYKCIHLYKDNIAEHVYKRLEYVRDTLTYEP